METRGGFKKRGGKKKKKVRSVRSLTCFRTSNGGFVGERTVYDIQTACNKYRKSNEETKLGKPASDGGTNPKGSGISLNDNLGGTGGK